jgi:hypothetical protein
MLGAVDVRSAKYEAARPTKFFPKHRTIGRTLSGTKNFRFSVAHTITILLYDIQRKQACQV